MQRNCKLLSTVLTEMYSAQQELKAGLAHWKQRAKEEPEDHDVQNAVVAYGKAIPKFKDRTKKLEELQKQLKTELKHAQMLEMWSLEDEEFWAEEARLKQAEQDGFVVAGSVMQCDTPPEGWYCTREYGHEGPCAARVVEG
jgi:hypothetical protein